MRAALYSTFRGPITVAEVPDPAPAPGEVVVEVLAVGLCRSDLHGWHGTDPDIACPHVGGHEFVGRVVARGAGVTRVAEGDRVVAPFVCGCGVCEPCRAGQQQVCRHQEQPGFTRWGAFAEFTTIPYADANAVVVPDEVGDVAAALAGCRVSTAYRAVMEQGAVTTGETMLVIGCGGVGLAAVALGRIAGARVVAVDVAHGALALARAMGAEVTVDARTVSDLPAAVVELTSGGAHVAVECLGHEQTVTDALLSLRPLGRHVQVGLFPTAAAPLPVSRIIRDELELRGVHGLSASRLPQVLALIADGRLDPAGFVTTRIALTDLPEALPAMATAPTPGVTVITDLDA